MNKIVILICVILPTLSAGQEFPDLPPTTCLENIIEIPYQTWNGFVPQCMDTLRIGYTRPMEPTGLMPVGTCAELFEVQRQGAVKTYRKIPSTAICENVDRVTVISSERLQPEYDPGKLRTYEVHTYCEYWRGKDRVDTTRIPFQISRGFRAHARAMDYETGMEILDEGLVEPTQQQAVNTGSAPFRLNAWSNKKYEFMFWTCTHATIPFDIYAPFQVITHQCWPVSVTTVFHAFFRPLTSTVSDVQQQTITVRRSFSSVTVERPLVQDGEILIMTVTGRNVRHQKWLTAVEQIDLDDVASGVYLLVVRDGHHTIHTPIHHY